MALTSGHDGGENGWCVTALTSIRHGGLSGSGRRLKRVILPGMIERYALCPVPTGLIIPRDMTTVDSRNLSAVRRYRIPAQNIWRVGV